MCIVIDRSLRRLRELDALFVRSFENHGVDRRSDRTALLTRIWSSAPCWWWGRRCAEARDARDGEQDEEGRVMVDISSIKAAASRPAGRPRMPSRRSSSMGSCTTASPTCPAPCRARRRSRSPTQRCLYLKQLADLGVERALAADPHLAAGLNVHAGAITCEAVARELKPAYQLYRVAA